MKALPSLRLLACGLAAVLPLAACGGKGETPQAKDKDKASSAASGSDAKGGSDAPKTPILGVDTPLPPPAGMPAPGADPYAPVPPPPVIPADPAPKPDALTQANLDKVVAGMDPAKVKALLGEPSETRELPNPVAGSRQTVFLYRAGGSSEARVVFTDGKVSEKSGSLPK